MDKIKFSLKTVVMLLFSILVRPEASAFGPEVSANSGTSYSPAYGVEDNDLNYRINNMDALIDFSLNPEIKRHIYQFTEAYKKGTNQLLGRTEILFPIFDEMIEERGLPEELKCLAIVESKLKTNAISRVGAAGPWQFMRGTGRQFGLRINSAVDQRRDIIKSTDAALEFLTQLYDRYGDWALALAAYNAGPGRVNSAIRRSGGETDFWKIRKYLPRETRQYVPKFIAACYLMKYYQFHDLEPIKMDSSMNELVTVKIYKKMNFSQLAKITGLNYKDVHFLNPAYYRHYIPSSKKGYDVLIPATSVAALLTELGREEELSEYFPVEKEEVKLVKFDPVTPIDVIAARDNVLKSDLIKIHTARIVPTTSAVRNHWVPKTHNLAATRQRPIAKSANVHWNGISGQMVMNANRMK